MRYPIHFFVLSIPATIPLELRELMFNRSPQWLSPALMQLLGSSLLAASRLPPAQPTSQPSIATWRSALSLESPSFTLCKRTPYAAMSPFQPNRVSKHCTIKAYLSGIRCWQIQHSMGNPFVDGAMPRLEYVLLGIKRVEAQAASRTRVRLPITIGIMQKLRASWAVPPSGA